MAEVLFYTDELCEKIKTDDEYIMGWLSDFLDSYDFYKYERKCFDNSDAIYYEIKKRNIDNVERYSGVYYFKDEDGYSQGVSLKGYCNITEFIKNRIKSKVAKDNIIEILERFICLGGTVIINNFWMRGSRDMEDTISELMEAMNIG